MSEIFTLCGSSPHERRGVSRVIRVALEDAEMQHLIETAPTNEERARLRALQSRTAGAFLSALHTRYSFRMRAEELACGIRFRLGLAPAPAPLTCPKRGRGKSLDELGLHANSCSTAARIHRHNRIRDAVARIVRRTGIQSLQGLRGYNTL